MSIQGTVSECFAHFAAQEFDRDPKKAVADFFGIVLQPTVSRWFTRFSGTGENLLKARYFLELYGYKPTELADVPACVQDLGRLYAYSIASFEDITEVFAFSGESPREQAFRVLLGKLGTSKERMQRICEYVEPLSGLIAERRDQWVADLPKRVQHATADAPAPTAILPLRKKGPDVREAIVISAATQVKALLPLCELLLSDEFSADERNHFRDLSGGDGVFKLANILHRLCGEKARAKFQQQATSMRR